MGFPYHDSRNLHGMSYTVHHRIREKLALISFNDAVDTTNFTGKGVLDKMIPNNYRREETHQLK